MSKHERDAAAECRSDCLVVVATYNEIENLPRLVDEILKVLPTADLLVIDDNSPDGTGRWCDTQAAVEPRFSCHHREGKLGLGSASITGFRHAIDQGYHAVLTLDADFSHPPHVLPRLLECLRGPEPCDVAVGSRYVRGGGVEGWPLSRRVMSRLVNWYARLALRLPCRDCSGAFRGYRVACLADLPPEAVVSRGYAYLEELLWRLKSQGAVMREIPFTFKDRELGQTKINLSEAWQAVLTIARLGCREWTGRR